MVLELGQGYLVEEVLAKANLQPDNNPLRKMEWATDYNDVVSKLVRGAIIGKRFQLGLPEDGYRDLQAITSIDGEQVNLSRRQKPYFYVPANRVEGWPGSDKELGYLWVCGTDLAKLEIAGFTQDEWVKAQPMLFQRDALFVYEPIELGEHTTLVRVSNPEQGILVPVDPYESGTRSYSITDDNAWMTTQLLHPAKIEFASPRPESKYVEDRLMQRIMNAADNVSAQMTGWGDDKDQLLARKSLVSTRVRIVLKEMKRISERSGK